MNVTSTSWPAPSNMKFESIVLTEEISALLKENQRDQEVILSFNIQLLLHQTQATRPGDVLQLKSIPNSIHIFTRCEFVFDIRYRI